MMFRTVSVFKATLFVLLIVVAVFAGLSLMTETARALDEVAAANPGDPSPGRDAGPVISVVPSKVDYDMYLNTSISPTLTVKNKGEGDLKFEASVKPVLAAGESADKKVLVMQDQSNWGWFSGQFLARVQGVTYDQVTDYTQIGSPSLDLSKYAVVVAAWNVQSYNWQMALKNNLEWFEDYVAKGGVMYIESGGNSGDPWILPIPGGMTATYAPDNPGRVVAGPDESPLIKALGWNKNQQLRSDSFIHNYYEETEFQNAENVGWYRVLAQTWNSRQPAIIAYSYGRGGVLVFGGPVCYNFNDNWGNSQPDSWGGNRQKIMDYLLSFSPFWASVTPLTGTVSAGARTDVTLNLSSYQSVGIHKAELHFKSNDWQTPDLMIPIAINVVDAPSVEYSWSKSAGYPQAVDFNGAFEELYNNGKYGVPITLKNTGTNDLTVTGVEFDGNEVFSVRRDVFTVGAGDKADLIVRIKSKQAGAYKALMIVYTNDPDQPALEIPVQGTTKAGPKLVFNGIDQIDGQLFTGEVINEPLIFRNEGAADLTYSVAIKSNAINAARRDDPGVDDDNDGFRIPGRDKLMPGDVIEKWQWGQNPNDGWQRAGIALDRDRNWMWLSSYSHNQIGAVSLPDRNTQRWFFGGNNGNPMDLAYYNGVIYSINWASNSIGRWNVDGGWLGQWNFNYTPGGVAVIPDKGYLICSNANSADQFVIHDINNNGAEIHRINGVNAIMDNNQPGPLEWVPEHTNGELWITGSWGDGRNHIVQAKVDFDRWTVSRIQQFPCPVPSNDWLGQGIGHDGKNLWFGPTSNSQGMYWIIEDGIDENQWMSVDPNEGTVKPNEQLEAVLTVNTGNLEAGVYSGSVTIKTNDPIKQTFEIPVNIDVENAATVLVTWNKSFGYPLKLDVNLVSSTLFNGANYSFPIKVINNGTARLSVFGLSSDNNAYSFNVGNFQLDPGAAQDVTVNFRPTDGAGDYGANLFVQSNDPRGDYAVATMATVVEPPEIGVDPADMAELLDVGEVALRELTISNTGGADLTYKVTHRYNVAARDAGVRHARQLGDDANGGVWVDEEEFNRIGQRDAAFGTEIKRVTWERANRDNMYRSGISYDGDRNWMWLSSYNNGQIGAIDLNPGANYAEKKMIQTNNQGGNPMDIAYFNGIIYVIGWANNGLQRWDINGNWLGWLWFNYTPKSVAVDPDKQYILCQNNNDNNQLIIHNINGGEITRINALGQMFEWNDSRSMDFVPGHKNGQIWFNVSWGDGFPRLIQAKIDYNNWTLTKVQSQKAPIQYNDSWNGVGHDGTNLWYSAYGNNPRGEYIVFDDGIKESGLLTYNPVEGTIAPNESAPLHLAINTRYLTNGVFRSKLIISHNDPRNNNAPIEVPINVQVAASPNAVVEWDSENGWPMVVDFNKKYRDIYADIDYKMTVNVVSSGTQNLDVELIGFDGDAAANFSADLEEIRGLAPESSQQLKLTFRAAEVGEYNAFLVLATNSNNEPEKMIPLRAVVATPPSMVLNPDELVVDTPTNTSKLVNLNISNVGGGDLRYAVTDETVDDARRDVNADRQRVARKLENSGVPLRDAKQVLGEQIGTVNWQQVSPGWNKGGIAYDAEHNWMWLTSYNSNRVGALDLNNNYAEVRNFNTPTNLSSIAYADGVLYGTYGGNSWVQRFDTDGQNMGQLNLWWGTGMITYVPEKEVFLTLQPWGTVMVMDKNGGQIASFEVNQTLANGNYFLSMVYVPAHTEQGALWFRCNDGTVKQAKINIDNWSVQPTANSFPMQMNDWWGDGIGHDGENLWIGNVNDPGYTIYTDGIDEYPWILYDVKSGSVAAGENYDFAVTLDAKHKTGEWHGNLILSTNDPAHKVVKVPVTLNVTPIPKAEVTWEESAGAPSKIDFNAYFGATYLTGTYEVPLTIANKGDGSLDINGIAFANRAYSASVARFSLLAGKSRTITVKFAPTAVGNNNDVMKITTNDPDKEEIRITLVANASKGPKLVASPDGYTKDDMVVGQKWLNDLTLENQGEADLNFAMDWKLSHIDANRRDDMPRDEETPAKHLSDMNSVLSARGDIVEPEGMPARDGQLGNLLKKVKWGRVGANAYKGGIAWDRDRNWMWLSNRNANQIGAIDLANDYAETRYWPSNNPLNGISYYKDRIYAWYYGWSSNIWIFDVDGNNVDNWDVGYSINGIAIDPFTGKMLVGNVDGNMPIKVYDVDTRQQVGEIDNYRTLLGDVYPRNFTWVPEHRNGQLWLNSANHIWQVKIDTKTWKATAVVSNFAPNLANPQEVDGIGHDGKNLWYGCYGPSDYYIYDDANLEVPSIRFDVAQGTVAPNAKQAIKVTIDATELSGDYEGGVYVISNDPKAPRLKLPVRISVQSAPDFAAEWAPKAGYPDVIDFNRMFPEVYVGKKFKVVVTVSNLGSEWLDITDISADNEAYTFNPKRFSLEPNQVQDVNVYLDLTRQQAGNYDGTITFASNDPLDPASEVTVRATAGTPPIFTLPEENQNLAIEVGNGGTSVYPMGIKNEGGAPLRFKVTHEMVNNEGRDGQLRHARSVGAQNAPVRRDEDITLTGMYAIFQDQSAWGWMDQGMMDRAGLQQIPAGQVGEGKYHTYRSANDLANVDFSQYNAIVFASGSQSGNWINIHNQNRARIEEYVANGGGVYYEMGNSNGVQAPGNITNDMDGGSSNGTWRVTYDSNSQDYHLLAEIANKLHGGNTWGLNHMIQGNSWCHSRFSQGQFTNNANLEWYKMVATTEGSQDWAAITYGMGSGVVLVCGSPTGHQWFNWTNNGQWGGLSKAILSYLEQGSGGGWIDYEKDEFVTAPGEVSPFAFTFSGPSKGGSYEAIATFTTNDPQKPTVEVPVTLNVVDGPAIEVTWDKKAGYPAKVDFDKLFGRVYLDGVYEVIIKVANNGNRPLSVDLIQADNDMFFTDKDQLLLQPKEKADVKLSFEAIDILQEPAHLIFDSDDPAVPEYSITLSATPLPAPELTLDPVEVIAQLPSAGYMQQVVTVTNDGQSELDYTIDQVTNDGAGGVLGNQIDQAWWGNNNNGWYHSGLAYDKDRNWMWATSYNANRIGAFDLNNNRQIVRDFSGNWNPMRLAYANNTLYYTYWSEWWLDRYDTDGNRIGQINMPFPVAAVTYIPEKNALLCIDANNDWRDWRVVNMNGQQIGTISNARAALNDRYGTSFNYVPEHKKFGGLWVTVDDQTITQLKLDTDNWTVEKVASFQRPGGNDWWGDAVGHDGKNLWVGVSSNQSYLIYQDGIDEHPWLFHNLEAGKLAPNEAVDLTITLDFTGKQNGDYQGAILIYNNDPKAQGGITQIPVFARVVSSSYPTVVWPKEAGYPKVLDWNKMYALEGKTVFAGGPQVLPVCIKNTGDQVLNVNEVATEGEAFVVPNGVGFAGLQPGDSTYVLVQLDVPQAGEYDGVLVINSNADMEGDVRVNLHAVAYDPPVISLDQDQFNLNMLTGEETSKLLTVSNAGANNLEFKIDVKNVNPEVVRDNVRRARRIGEELVPLRDDPVLTARYAVFQDQEAYGWLDTYFFNQEQGLGDIDFDSYRNSGAWDVVNYDDYDAIVVAFNNQSQPYYDAYNRNFNRFSQYILDGGTAYFTTGGGAIPNVSAPGNIRANESTSTNGKIVISKDPAAQNYSPLAELVDRWIDGYIIKGSNLFHAFYLANQFANVDWYQPIATFEGNANRFGAVAYKYGMGGVVLAGDPVGHQFRYYNHSQQPNEDDWGSIAEELLVYLTKNLREQPFISVYEGDVSEVADMRKWVPATNKYSLTPGAASQFTAVINTTGLKAGNHAANINFVSNDPSLENGIFPVFVQVALEDAALVHVTPGGPEFGNPPVDFAEQGYGKVYLDHPRPMTVTVTNGGSELLQVAEITTDNDRIYVNEADQAFDVDPGKSADIQVWFNPEQVGLAEATLLFKTNDPREAFQNGYPVKVKAVAAQAPSMLVTPDGYNDLAIPKSFDQDLKLVLKNNSDSKLGDALTWWTSVEKADLQVRDNANPVRRARRIADLPVSGKFTSVGTIAESQSPSVGVTPVAPTRDIEGGLYAVFQDQSSWGWLYQQMMDRVLNQLPVNQFGDGYHKYTSSADWNNVEFNNYKAIVIAGYNQSANYNSAYENNRARLEDYVSRGGSVYMEVGQMDNTQLRAPGGVLPRYSESEQFGRVIVSPNPKSANYNHLAELANKAFGGDVWSEGYKLEGGNLFYSTFEMNDLTANNALSWSQALVESFNSRRPGVVAYGMGFGTVMVYTGLPGHSMANYRGPAGWGALPDQILQYLVDWSSRVTWLSFDKTAGVLQPGRTQEFRIFLNIEDLPRGTYAANLHFFSSDPSQPDDIQRMNGLTDADVPDVTVPVNFTIVSATPVAMIDPVRLDFSDAVVGEDLSKVVTISNIGNLPLEISGIAVLGDNADQFSFQPEFGDPVVVEADEFVKYTVHYKPLAAGAHEAQVIISTNIENAAGGKYATPLAGVSKPSPVIAIDPGQVGLTLDNLMGDKGTVKFKVKNNAAAGSGDLSWSMSINDVVRDDQPRERHARRIGENITHPELIGRDEPTSKFAIFEQVSPWGYDMEQLFKNVYGTNYTRFKNFDNFDQIDLNGYDVIWVANNQTDRWNAEYNNNIARIEDWVDRGGVYYMSTGTSQWGVAPEHPGKLVRKPYVYSNTGVVEVRRQDNYWFNLMGWDRGTELNGRAFANASYPQEKIDGIENSNFKQVLIRGKLIGDPLMVLYTYGDGWCLANAANDGFLHANASAFEYGLSGEELVWYLDELAQGKKGWVRATPPMGILAAGEEQEVTVMVDAGNVKGNPGDQVRANIVLKSNDQANLEKVVQVTLTILPAPAWAVTVTNLVHEVVINDVTFDGGSGKGLWVGAFNPAGTVCGFGRWIGDKPMKMLIFGDNPATPAVEGYKSGEKLTFRLLNRKTDVEYNNVQVIVSEGFPRFIPDGHSTVKLVGSPRMADERQTIALTGGWNLISLNVKPGAAFWKAGETRGPDVTKIIDVFKTNDSLRVVLVKDEAGHFYAPGYKFNNIPYWDLSDAYWVKADRNVEGSWNGSPIPRDQAMPLHKGVNFVSYYPSYELSMVAPDFYAFGGIVNKIDIVKDGAGHFAMPRMGWSNLPNLKAGNGYVVKVTEDVAFTYPAKAAGAAGIEEAVVGNHWLLATPSDQNMSLLVSGISGYTAVAGDQIGAFNAEGVLVGVGNVTSDGLSGVTVWGDDPTTVAVEGLAAGSGFTLKLWNSTTNTETALALSGVRSGNGLVYETNSFTAITANANASLPTDYYLTSAYPNPFNAVTQLNYGLPEASRVTIKVYDVTGRMVASLVDGSQVAGHHVAVWEAKGVSSGIYLIRMETSSFTSVKKVMMVK